MARKAKTASTRKTKTSASRRAAKKVKPSARSGSKSKAKSKPKEISRPTAAARELQPNEADIAMAARAEAAMAAVEASGLDDEVAIPPADTFNVGLHFAPEATMLELLGTPGRKTRDCSSPTMPFARRIKSSVNVGPFRVSGLDIAVDSLKAVFAEAKEAMPEVVAAVKTEGMLCVRHKRNNPDSFSNHSWGAAIDLFFGGDVVPQGRRKTHKGVLLLAPIFNRHGWFWGAGFSGASVDSMHFELAEETIRAARG
jgi:hypothetical protein